MGAEGIGAGVASFFVTGDQHLVSHSFGNGQKQALGQGDGYRQRDDFAKAVTPAAAVFEVQLITANFGQQEIGF
jgi:hypothetical protein